MVMAMIERYHPEDTERTFQQAKILGVVNNRDEWRYLAGAASKLADRLDRGRVATLRRMVESLADSVSPFTINEVK